MGTLIITKADQTDVNLVSMHVIIARINISNLHILVRLLSNTRNSLLSDVLKMYL